MAKRFQLIPVVVLAGALLAAACGGGGGSSEQVASLGGSSDAEPGSTADAPTDPEEAQLAFEQCMADQGVDHQGFATSSIVGVEIDAQDVPDAPTSGSSDPDDLQAAFDACGDLLDEAFGEFELTPEQEAEMRDQQLAFEQCLADNGVELPTFDEDNGAISFGGEDMDMDAFRECGSELGSLTFGSEQ